MLFRSTPKEANKSKPSANLPPPPPQLPADLKLKPIPELKKRRPNEVLKEGEVGFQREISSKKWLKTSEAEGLLLLKAERILSRLMCAEHRAYGFLSWS